MFEKRARDERGQIAPKTIMIGGFAMVAVVVALWIGNTVAGSAADAASCIVDPKLNGENVCRNDTGNAQIANDSRPSGGAFIGNFGSVGASPKFASTELSQAKVHFQRGIARFSGTKLTIYTNSQSSLSSLASASNKAQAYVALTNLKNLVDEASRNGETSTNGRTIKDGATILDSLNHPARVQAWSAQSDGEQGLAQLKASAATLNDALVNYDSMSLAQLKAVGPTTSASLQSAQQFHESTKTKLEKTIQEIDENR